MRYLLIDHITGWEAGKSIKGIKNVAMSEDFLEFHFRSQPIMPGILLLEALTQLAGWLEAASSDFTNWITLVGVEKCNFYGFALPGDQVELEVAPLESKGEARRYAGIGRVKGKKKIRVEFEGELTPLAELEDPRTQQQLFEILIRKVRM